MDLNKLVESLDKIISGFQEFRNTVATDLPTNQVNLSAQTVEVKEEELDSFEKLKTALMSDRWPAALPPEAICNIESVEEKRERGVGVIEVMVEEILNGKKFLDYGCGEGYTTLAAAQKNAALALGYDPFSNKAPLANLKNLLLTDNYSIVKDNAPYDAILIYDVIDHAVGEQPTEILRKANELLSEKGRIYLRTHPFTSRHATHLYHDLNKAYIHLVFTTEELNQIFTSPSKYGQVNIGETRPLDSYDRYIQEAGLKSVHRRISRENAEPFFTSPYIAERIKAAVKIDSFPEWQLSLSWVDFVLVKNNT